jgi:hypothetical protein
MSLILGRLSPTALLGATGVASSSTPSLFMSSATLGLGLGARARPVLSTFGRSALIGGLALTGTGNRSFTTGTEGGGHDVGKLVSTATEKFGLGDNQVWRGKKKKKANLRLSLL